MLKIFCISLLIVSFIGCSNTITDGKADRDVKTFRGEYLSNNIANNIGSRKTDSLILTIINNQTYSIRFFDVSENDKDFCSHTGYVDDFWTSSVTFTIGSIDYNNCDTLHLPKKTFTADFLNHGDTILLERIMGDTIRKITLLK